MTSGETESKAGLRRLCSLMKLRKEKGDPPFLFLLGAGASTNSGYPGAKGFIKQALSKLGRDAQDIADSEKLRQLFDEEWKHIGLADRYRIVREVFPPVSPSPGLYYLAQLVSRGFIQAILTTNIDPLLENSLAEAGVPLPHQNLLIIGVHERERVAFMMNTLLREGKPFVVKLHGDANWDKFAFTQDEIKEWLEHEMETNVKGLMQQRGLVVIGHSLQDSDIQNCLTPTSGKFEQSLFFVSTTGRCEFLEKRVDLFPTLSIVRDEESDKLGDFDSFVTQLFHRCLSEEFAQASGEVLFNDSFQNNDLAGLQFIGGSYGIRDKIMWLGNTEQTAIAIIPHVVARELEVKSKIEIEDDGGDPENWVGFMLRATNKLSWPDGCFVYFRSNGNIDLMDGRGQIIATERALESPKNAALEVSIIARGNRVEVRVANRLIVERESSELPNRFGRIFLYSYKTRSKFHSIQLRNIPPYLG